MSHTPGPWLIREGFSFDTWEVYPTRDGPPEFGEWAELATVQGEYGDDGGAEGLANARLIAAAPTMKADIDEFMRRLGPRWFLEQGWFPASVLAEQEAEGK